MAFPKSIKVRFTTDEDVELAVLVAGQKTFASGKIGYGAYNKVRLPNGERLQVSLNLPVVKSDGKSF